MFDAHDYDEQGIVPLPDGSGRVLAYWGYNPYSEVYETWNDAARAIIDAAVTLYAEFHDVSTDEVDVSTNTRGDGDRIIGYRLSLDVDGVSRGCDEHDNAVTRTPAARTAPSISGR